MMVKKAMHFAMEAHEGQERKYQDVPYVWHCISVAKLVEIYKESDSMNFLRVCALLHDTVEDTDVTLSIIADEFNHNVSSVVDEVTSDGEMIEKIGKTEYLKKSMLDMSNYALYEKLCDRLDNTLDLKLTPQSFRERYAQETDDIITHLLLERTLTDSQYNVVRKIKTELDKIQY